MQLINKTSARDPLHCLEQNASVLDSVRLICVSEESNIEMFCKNVQEKCVFFLFVCFLEERKKQRKHPAETSESKCAE